MMDVETFGIRCPCIWKDYLSVSVSHEFFCQKEESQIKRINMALLVD